MILTPEQVLARSPDFQRKLIRALAIVTQALHVARRPYVAFSGGKDSMAVTALVHQVDPFVPLIWSDDELEYPETVELMTSLRALAGPQLVITLGHAEHAGWFRPWADAPFWREPFAGSLRIEQPVEDWSVAAGYDCVFLGTRREENRRRDAWLLRAGHTYRMHGQTRCCPIEDWSADEVWALMAHWDLPHNAVYDRLAEIGVPRKLQRVGPLPLAFRRHLEAGWPELLARLETRYGRRWGE